MDKDSKSVADWLKQGRFLAHDHINELVSLMGQVMLRKVLARLKSAEPSWFSIIADGATDVVYQKQLNLSILYVDNEYELPEDSLGLLQMPATDAATIVTVINDILLRTSLPLTLPWEILSRSGSDAGSCKRTGLATRLKQEEETASPVHCLARSLNVCLKDASR